ncbi:M protein, serotype 49-like [Dendropsophus ebraccatus]|uniref:M protein, serotype 49-like n=1 Tax=Dendropsophus ebraccatus TaxID=150705 RepID=UPI003831F3F8
MRPCQKEISEGQEEVQHEAESPEKTSGRKESSGGDREENLAVYQNLPDNEGEERRPGQGAAVETKEGLNGGDIRQDGMNVEQATSNTQGMLDKSIDDQVVSEKTTSSDGRPSESSERVEEELQTSALTKDLHELKVVDQEEHGRKMKAHEEAGMPVEPRKDVPVEDQKQIEMAVVVQEKKEMKVEGQEHAEMAVLFQEEKEMKVEDQVHIAKGVVVQDEKEMKVEGQEHVEMAVLVQEEKEMKVEDQVHIAKGVVVQEEKEMNMEGQVQIDVAVVVREEKEKMDIQEQVEMAAVVQKKMEGQEQANIRMEAQASTERRVVAQDTAEIEPQSSTSDEKDQTVEEETTAKSCDQGTKLVRSAPSDEEQQKMMQQLLAEINSHVCEKDVHIQPLQGDFSEFSEVQVDSGRFGHIIELYGFSSELSAEDLMEPFKEYRDRGFRLQWVDQTHALGIFSSPEDAYAASCQMHPAMKFRPLSQGSRQSKFRAYEKAAFMYPHVERPRCDATVAKRLVSHALALPKEAAVQSVVERAQT